MNPMFNRRTFLQYAAMGLGSAYLAACAAPVAAPGAAPAAPADAVADKGKLEIFSWWTAGGEVEGLNNMFKIFERDNPGVEIINAALAAQGAGQGGEMKALLEKLITDGRSTLGAAQKNDVEVKRYPAVANAAPKKKAKAAE